MSKARCFTGTPNRVAERRESIMVDLRAKRVGSRRRREGGAADFYDRKADREMRTRKIAGDHL